MLDCVLFGFFLLLVCEFLLWWLNAGFQDTLKVEGVGFGFGDCG